MTTTSRKSPRCPNSGTVVDYDTGIIDCTCGRPVRAMQVGLTTSHKVIPSHGTVRTRNTDAADDRLRQMRELAQRLGETG